MQVQELDELVDFSIKSHLLGKVGQPENCQFCRKMMKMVNLLMVQIYLLMVVHVLNYLLNKYLPNQLEFIDLF